MQGNTFSLLHTKSPCCNVVPFSRGQKKYIFLNRKKKSYIVGHTVAIKFSITTYILIWFCSPICGASIRLKFSTHVGMDISWISTVKFQLDSITSMELWIFEHFYHAKNRKLVTLKNSPGPYGLSTGSNFSSFDTLCIYPLYIEKICIEFGGGLIQKSSIFLVFQ